MSELILHELTPSPNNVRVRLALGYKGLDYERKPIDLGVAMPGDRSPVVALSGQPRLPVLQHGDRVIFDSAAIIRYLEANFRDTPPLFVQDYQGHSEVEKWEHWPRAKLGDPFGMVFGQVMAVMAGAEVDAAAIAMANEMLHESTGELEERLEGREWLAADHMTIGDIASGAPLYLVTLSAEQAEAMGPFVGFFHKHVTLGEGRDKTRAWVKKLLAYDKQVIAA